MCSMKAPVVIARCARAFGRFSNALARPVVFIFLIAFLVGFVGYHQLHRPAVGSLEIGVIHKNGG